MCDYSLQTVKTRDAALHDELITSNFGTGTRGFACKDDPACAVCVKPGTEIAFDGPVELYVYGENTIGTLVDKILSNLVKLPTVAVFRQINKAQPCMHHDALEFADGKVILLTYLKENQRARILQMPAQPQTQAEREEQTRVATVG